MKKAEIIIMALAMVAVVLNFMLVPGGVLLTIFTFTLLAIIYFNLGFALFNQIRLRHILKKESYVGIKASRIIGCIGTGFALSMVTIGLLIKLLAWPGAYINLLAGLFFVAIALLISTIKFFVSKAPFYKPIIIRCIGFLIIGITLMNLRPYALMDFKYRNYPEYLSAFKAREADPSNAELRDRLEEERIKMDHAN